MGCDDEVGRGVRAEALGERGIAVAAPVDVREVGPHRARERVPAATSEGVDGVLGELDGRVPAQGRQEFPDLPRRRPCRLGQQHELVPGEGIVLGAPPERREAPVGHQRHGFLKPAGLHSDHPPGLTIDYRHCNPKTRVSVDGSRWSSIEFRYRFAG